MVTNRNNKIHSKLISKPLCIILALLLIVLMSRFYFLKAEMSEEDLKSLNKSNVYTGNLWKTDSTLSKTLLGETPFARCDMHKVKVGENKIVDDWIFMEERDAINVAVFMQDGKLLAFQQQKYAIPGETLSPVGGFINNGESPFDAARREVWEELGVGSNTTKEILKSGGKLERSAETKASPFGTSETIVKLDEYGLMVGNVSDDESSSWVFLGKYRTMANRGGGFIYTYLLKDAIPLVEGGGTSKYLSRGDTEDQTLLHLSHEEATEALLEGRFQEVKWAATLALGLLHMEKRKV
mmetsp:Transcript_17912/g.26514  ORF Transcript_17912/g.26514 Transcript_17912/m.26514 type:complete len:296 (+) Transcript_17912:40-927(+)